MPIQSRKNQALLRRREYKKKVSDYRKFLSDDEDWDYYHILRLLQYKLERTRKCILKNSIVVAAPRIAKQINEVEYLLARVMEDRYFNEISKDFSKKYGKLKMIFGRKIKGAKSIPVTTRFQKENPKNAKNVRREFIRLQNQAWKMRQSDLKKAFALMHKNIWGWWD